MSRAASSLVVFFATAVMATPLLAASSDGSSTDSKTHGAATQPRSSRQASAAKLAPIQVSAQRSAPAKVEQHLTPGAVTVVDAKELSKRAVNNMADVLRYVPGVRAVSQTGGDDLRIHIRGSNLHSTSYDNSGVLLLQDGLPVTTADGNNHNRLLSPAMVHRVIVAPGANGMKYGSAYLGGAIDFISPTARNSGPLELFLHGGSYGSYGGLLRAGHVFGALDGMVTVAGKHRRGYRAHNKSNDVSAHANGGWQATDKLSFRLFADYINSRQRLPGGLTRAQFEANPNQANASYVKGDHQLNVETYRLAGKGNWQIDADSWLEFGLSWEQQHLYHPIVTSPFFSLLIDTTQRTVGGTTRYHRRIGHHKLLAGVNVAFTLDQGGNYTNNGGRIGTLMDTVNQHSDNFTLFLVDRWNFLPKWTLVYGAQGVVTGRNDAVRHVRDEYTAFNPRLGLLYAFTPNQQAYASVSRVFQAPNNFGLNNARGTLGNNATLKAMRGWNYELGLRGDKVAHRVTWHWDVSLYYARLRNELLSTRNLDPSTSSNTSFLTGNAGRTTHAGVEALLRVAFAVGAGGDHIKPLISATYNNFFFDDNTSFGDNRMPVVPNYAIHGELIYDSASGFYGGPTFDFVGARYGDFANRYRVDAYQLVGLRTGYQHGHWEVFAEGRNLAGSNYVANLSPVARADASSDILMPGAPRSVYVGMRWRY